VPPPKPRLFKAVAILGMLLGSLGTASAFGGLMSQSKVDRPSLEAFGLGPKTDEEARITRKLQQKIEHVLERHRGVTVGLHATNGVLSLLLLVGSLTIASGRAWAHSIMVQALVASGLYELPAAAHQIRLVYETMLAQRRLIPDLLRAAGQPATVDDLALTTGSFLVLGIAATVVMALLRLAFYGTGFWYLRRRDVRAWFSMSHDT